ncbi:hypothetical protein JW711_00335, partial [Candidatus Woesearchaeota archaeon]|nr:hypothetical protein [Candidatus Woesearchaeota archaeon]
KLVERSRKLSEYFYLHGMFIFGYPTFKDSVFKSDLSLKKRAKAYARFFRDARIDTVQVLNAVPLPGSRLRARLEAEGRLETLEKVGWDKYDGMFLCYDPLPEGLDGAELEMYPKVLMNARYAGNLLNRTFNYGNWMNWAFVATIGFPLQFSAFYVRRFFHNLADQRRIRSMTLEDSLLPQRNIFHAPLVRAWGDVKRVWRNLAIRTYAAGIVRRWYKASERLRHRT